MNNIMSVNGLYAQINLPDAPQGDGVHGLPPYNLQNVYQVDDYACPINWMHGSGNAASYFLPVESGKHLWLDFNKNWSHSHYVAIVLSVQGINPITGLPTKSLRLEQYRSKCIIHGCDFGADRFCQQCNDNVPGVYDGSPVTTMPSKWPPQNYMTTARHQGGALWIDGWRAENNTIRGFLITSETLRGIAQQIIGEDRVWAIGVGFYLSKAPKPAPPQNVLRTASFGSFGSKLKSSGISGQSITAHSFSVGEPTRWLDTSSEVMSSLSFNCQGNDETYTARIDNTNLEVEQLEIGAGAKIEQEVCSLDPNEPSFYQDEPAGLIYINYCTKADFDKIMAAGKIDRSKGGEGFMAGLKTGN